ncbi:hypothetical protein [Halpernia frigidisoli]|uniref:Uncharacterized protein n=1 Tax=Halpernia frigidisoli TaxID=1125876 RepID=A0A1I3GIY5_9FLAO|nr:hypothetical protein [Halpernia frigidisoli]SFI23404.1 hypothetical protein SAMN05443292_1865 [Halpernia frigidisoli]
MNTEQYHKLLQKFYDGQTTVAEENVLKSSEHLSAEDSLYFETLKEEKKEKLNLDFEQFLALANKEKSIAPEKKESQFKWVWLAASLIFIFSIGAFWLNNSKNDQEKVSPQIASADIYKRRKVEIMQENTYEPVAENAKPDVQKMAKSDDVLDDILPKKSRMKKRVIRRYVSNSKPENAENKTEYQSNYVIINGHKITSEKEAIDVTKYSFQILANNVNQTVEQADVLNTLNMDK